MFLLTILGKLRGFLSQLIGSILVIVITFLLAISSLVFLPYRVAVVQIARFLRPDLKDTARGAMNSFFAVNSGTIPTVNISTFVVFDGKITVEVIRDRFQKRILVESQKGGTLLYEKLTEVIVPFMGYRFFRKADSFDLSSHIRQCDKAQDLGLPAGAEVTTKELEQVSGKLNAKPWVIGQSNWEMLVIDKYWDEDAGRHKSIMFMRINHAYGDGYSIQGIVEKLSDTGQEFERLKLNKSVETRPAGLQLLHTMGQYLKAIWDLGGQLCSYINRSSPWTLRWPHSKPREFMSVFARPVPVHRIKEIKNKFRISYSTVLLAAFAAALRRITVKSGEQIAGKIFCVFPLAKANHPGGMTNHFLGGAMTLPLPEALTTSTIGDVDQHVKMAMTSCAPLMTNLWLLMMSNLPAIVGKFAATILSPAAGLSLFPITKSTCYQGSIQTGTITVVTGLAHPATNGITVSIGGSGGQQRMAVTMEIGTSTDPQIFSRMGYFIDEEIEAMHKASVNSASSEHFEVLILQ